MEITEVRVKLVEENNERLRAFCSLTLDGDFVIRDLKVIDGTNGSFVAMPSRKLTDRCPKCGTKNHLRSRFCNECGSKLGENRAPRGGDGRMRLHADIAHPINSACRERIQNAVIEAYEEEMHRSKEPGYKPQRLDEDDYSDGDFDNLIQDLRTDARERSERRQGMNSSPGSNNKPAQPAESRSIGANSETRDRQHEPGGSEDFAAGID
jgi:stage V sporulation protein G